jgi:rubrerythrin
MDARAVLSEYGAQALVAVGGVAGVIKGGAALVQSVVTAKAKRAAFEQRVLDGIDEARNAARTVASTSEALKSAVEGVKYQLTEHDKRTRETAELVREAREDLSALRGEVLQRVHRVEQDASTARHVASEADALARNAHQRLDTAPAFGRPRSKA